MPSGNTIGGTAAGAGNVISGNTDDGVEITGTGTTGNVVAGNYIGTDVTGTVALGNGLDGVEIDTGASGNIDRRHHGLRPATSSPPTLIPAWGSTTRTTTSSRAITSAPM